MTKQFEIYVAILVIIIAIFVVIGFAKEVESNDNRHIEKLDRNAKQVSNE